MTIADEHIVSIMTQEPEKGFRLLMNKYQEPVYWHIRRMLQAHDDAQDVAQNTFVKIFRTMDKLFAVNSLRSWIYKVATNEALSFLRTRKEQVCQLDEVMAERMPADEYFNYDNLEAVKLQKAIQSLPTKQGLTFNLRYYDELSYDEIASVIGSTATNAKSNYHIAKEKIIKYMNA